MYNVLHILTGDDGGITAVVKNYYSHIDREKIRFDIACVTENEGNDINILKNLGANIFHLPVKSLGIKKYSEALEKLLNKTRYDAIHVHENETSYVALKIAKRLGVKNRIAHAHTTSPYRSFSGEIRRLSGILLNYYYATAVIGCGQLAGERVFGKWNMKRKKGFVLPNAVDFEKYAYNEQVRTRLRDELAISDKFVVGFIGRLAPEKNPIFCLDIIKGLHSFNENAVLVMAGDGCEEEKIRDYIHTNQMEEYVFLLGKRMDAECLYQAFDVLILPSIHEGFPVVVVEALASGLPAILSSNITKEFTFSDIVRYIDISDKTDWIDSLTVFSNERSNKERMNNLDPSVFDVKCVVKKLEEIYCTRQ